MAPLRRPPARKRALRPRRVPDGPPRLAPPVVRVALREEVHAHIVCRVCGRIQSVELTELDRHFLEELAGRPPEGWSVDGIAYSLTGACRRCREGPSA
jgi:Fe2+ or Zn2+ uptake regulation protein